MNELYPFSQKILHNSKHVDASKEPFMQRMYAVWNYVVENVLGLKPLNLTNKSNSKEHTVDASKNPFMQRMYAMWNYFVENVLGLKPNSKEDTDQQDEGAFELLRV